MIRIDVRDDDDVTRLEGPAGLAIVLQTDVLPSMDYDNLKTLDLPVVSLRASNSAQLAVMLGALIAVVRDHAPEALSLAFGVAQSASAHSDEALIERILPPKRGEGGP